MASRSRTLTFWFGKSIPVEIAEALRGVATVQQHSFTILEADRVDWSGEIQRLRREDIWRFLRGFRVGEQHDVDWTNPGGHIVGAVVSAADVQRAANRPDEYSPRLPLPEMGYLPEGVAIEVRDIPRVDVTEVGEDLVLSAKLARYLASLCRGTLGDVTRRGRTLPGFQRLFPQLRGALLSAICRRPEVPCQVCGAPMFPVLGIWLAPSATALPGAVFQDQLGVGHLGAQHPLITSPEISRVLRANFGKGLVLEPIYADSSESAAWATSVVRTVEE